MDFFGLLQIVRLMIAMMGRRATMSEIMKMIMTEKMTMIFGDDDGDDDNLPSRSFQQWQWPTLSSHDPL